MLLKVLTCFRRASGMRSFSLSLDLVEQIPIIAHFSKQGLLRGSTWGLNYVVLQLHQEPAFIVRHTHA